MLHDQGPEPGIILALLPGSPDMTCCTVSLHRSRAVGYGNSSVSCSSSSHFIMNFRSTRKHNRACLTYAARWEHWKRSFFMLSCHHSLCCHSAMLAPYPGLFTAPPMPHDRTKPMTTRFRRRPMGPPRLARCSMTSSSRKMLAKAATMSATNTKRLL